MNVADMIINLYAAESMLLRVQKLANEKGEEACAVQIAAVKVFVYDVADKINVSGKNALASFADGDEARMLFMGLKRFTKVEVLNTKDARRKVAEHLAKTGSYKM